VTTRKARQARTRLVVNKIIIAGLMLAALGAIYGLVRVIRPVTLASAAPAAQTARLSVTTALLGCPAPGSAGITGGGVALANLPESAAAGQVVLTRLNPGAAGTRVGTSPRSGQLTFEHVKAAAAVPKALATPVKMAGGLVRTTPARGGLIISAAGANAQGLNVEQLGPGGQPTAQCQSAGSDFWFVGPGSPTLHLYLYLMNTDNVPADAAVSVQTDAGPLLGPQDAGIAVPPHSMIVQNLDKLVHAARATALHVTTSTGRVVAAVRDTTSTGKEGAWQPAAGEPARTQILAGLPTNPGNRELYVTVPGNAPAQVKVTVINAHGSYEPTGGALNILGHQTIGVPIPSLGGTSGSIEITANVPVTGALEVSGGPSGAPGAFIVGSAPIIGQGVLAASPTARVGTTDLVLSAPKRAASVSVSYAVQGSPLSTSNGQVVHIPARSSVQLRLKGPKRSAATLMAIMVAPQAGSGPVYAGRVAVIYGLVQTVQPVVSSPATVELVPVRESLLAILGS
jgi:hypothetical protein